jgi:uncharacterized membrane protein SpoIIM required for sporulation
MEMSNSNIAVFTTVFFILLGVGFGIVLATHQPGATEVAMKQYDTTIGNQTYSAVQQGVASSMIPLWVAIILFVLILAINNGAVAFLLTYAPLYFDNWFGYVVSSYLLVVVGYFPASVAMNIFQLNGGMFVLASFFPHGVFEIAAVIIGASAGYCYLMGDKTEKDRNDVKRVLMRRVLPLIVIGSLVEVFITPVIIWMIM